MYGWYFYTLVVICVVHAEALVCFNCTSTHGDFTPCEGTFVKPPGQFNASRFNLINCTDNENSMCFVRAWSVRAHHAWIVQRGCYSVEPQDPILREMITPTRAMTCKHERLADAEYTVCLCKSDWCNSVEAVGSDTKYFSLWFSILTQYFCYWFRM